MRRNPTVIGLVLALGLSVGLAATASADTETWRHGGATGRAMVCVPAGTPPFPAVVFNHGLVVDRFGLNGAAEKGYDLAAICRAFAGDGFLGVFPIRDSGRGNMRGHVDEVMGALAAARARADVDADRIALAGFSRGGLLTLLAALRGVPVRALVMLAPAPGRGHLESSLARVEAIAAPVLMMVENDDDDVIRRDVDRLEVALRAAGKPFETVRYDRGGGHRLFWDTGYYWPELIRFLRRHLGR